MLTVQTLLLLVVERLPMSFKSATVVLPQRLCYIHYTDYTDYTDYTYSSFLGGCVDQA